MMNSKLLYIVGLAAFSVTACKTTQTHSESKTNIFSVGQIPPNVSIGHGYNVNSQNFLQNCTNINPSSNGTVREVELQVERSRLQEDYDGNSQGHTGDVTVTLGKNSFGAGGSQNANQQNRRAVIDEEIYIKRRVHSLNGNFISQVGIVAAHGASSAFNSNCGSEYVDEVAYGGALSITMDLNSSQGEVDNEVHSKVKTDPIAFLKNVAIEASQSSEWASKYKNYSLSLSLDSNQTLECLNSADAKFQSCNLATAEGCNAMSQKIEVCKEEFRTKVIGQDAKSFTTPITVGTTPYPADNATASYWQSQVNTLENYMEALDYHKSSVDRWQDQAMYEVTQLLSQLNSVLVQCIYRGVSQTESVSSTGSTCDRFIPEIVRIKGTDLYENYMKIKPEEIGIKGLVKSAIQKNEGSRGTNYHTFEYIQAPGKTLEIDVDQRKNGRFDVLVQRTTMDDVPLSIEAKHNPIFDNGQTIVIPASNFKQKIKLFPTHDVYSWSRARTITRRSVCVVNDDKMSASCDNRFTGDFNHITIRIKIVNP